MSRSLALFLIALSSMFFMSVKAQEPNLYEGLSLKGSGGLTSFHGDMTKSPFGQISDVQPGFSINGIKMFNPRIGIQVRYFSGNMSVVRPDTDQQYTGQISEIGLAARIEPLSYLGSNGPRKLYPYARVGISSASFRSIRWKTSTGIVIPPSFGYKLDNVTKGPKENSLSIPIALGFGFRINDKISLEIEHSTSITNNDNMDAFAGTGKYDDMFGFTNIGIRYNLGPSYKGKPKEDSKRKTKEPRTSTKSRKDDEENKDDKELAKEEIVGSLDAFDYTIPITTVYVESIIPENPLSGKMFEVNLRIHKDDYKGPATITQLFPSGFTVLEAPIRHAKLAFTNQQLTISWSQMPVDSVVTVVYHVHIHETISGPEIISGNIRYSQPEGSNKYIFENHIYVLNRNEAKMDEKFLELIGTNKANDEVYSKSVILSSPTYSKTNNITAEKSESEEELDLKIERLLRKYDGEELEDQSTSSTIVNSTSNSISGTYKPGVEFRIQCGAFRTRGEQYDLIKKYNIRETMTEQKHNGYYKYTVGSLSTFKEAERWRDSFIKRTNLLSVFIVAYRDGIRLNHVNEAR